jgi:hypothetical protein
MAKKPLRSQLNQIRAWVRQGRTDAWIAHQLDVSASELREFRRRHELSAEDEDTGEVELRDEIEAEIEALSETAEEEEAAEEEAEDDEKAEAEEGDEKREGEGSGRRRRRRRRRGRGGGGGGEGGDGAGTSMQATFDHGDTDGYGLWLDPSVSDDPVYSEHWAGHRKVEVTIEPDRIVVKRV